MSERGERSEAQSGGRALARVVGLAACLAAVWLLMSGHFEPLLLGFGLASLALTIAVVRRMDLIDREGVPLRLALRGLSSYWPWLAWEIVKANIDVAKRVVDPKLPIAPRLFETRASQPTDLGQVIYANSITLTPGTVSVDLDPGVIRVHAISAEGAADLEAGEMDRRVTALDGA